MRLVFLSPHLDDAVFSAGALMASLASAHRVEMHTLLAGGVPEPGGFALECQLDKGLARDVDYMALRRAEDERAAKSLGVRAVHYFLYEAPNRGYENAISLFQAPRSGDPLKTALVRLLPNICDGADLVFAPYGLGDHVDHLLVREAAERIASGRLVLWKDMPYALRTDRGPEWQVFARGRELPRKLSACAAYASQLGFQFGNVGAMKTALERDFQLRGEGFWPTTPGADERFRHLLEDE